MVNVFCSCASRNWIWCDQPDTELTPISWNLKTSGLYSLLCGLRVASEVWATSCSRIPTGYVPRWYLGILQLCGPQIDPYGDDCPILGATNHHPDDEGRVFTIYNLQFTFHSLQTSSLSHDSGDEGGAISEDKESNPDDVNPISPWITMVGGCQRNINTCCKIHFLKNFDEQSLAQIWGQW